MLQRTAFAAALLAVGATAQGPFQIQNEGGIRYAVNIPSSTAASKDGPIFFQMLAPSGTQWLGLGQGGSMVGANIFMMYASGSDNNVTVSPRLGTGHQEPQYDASTATSITLLAGSGVQSDGSLVANIRCDGCISWSGGSMDPTDTSSGWIWAVKDGSDVDSTDLSANLPQHDTMGTFSLDLTAATGGSSSNPFLASSGSGSASSAASASASGAAPSSATSAVAGATSAPSTTGGSAATATSAVSVTSVLPLPTSSGSSSASSSISSGNKDGARTAHGVIMSILFLLFFPLFALTMYLPYANRVRFVHAPLQLLSIVLLIVGLACGVILGKSIDTLDGYHQILGYVLVACLVLFQPALGIYQHMHYRRTGGRSALGIFHLWLGRGVILLGVVNGGLGFMQTGPIGSEYVPHGAVVGYSIVAVVVFLIYLAVVVLSKFRARKDVPQSREKPYQRGYEMHPSTNEAPLSPTNPNYQSRNYALRSLEGRDPRNGGMYR